MEKILRSLIHEKIPSELRFQLELLSRKRNLINEEKHEKIIELLREFDIKGVVQLGPGTNRYAIKIDGYVVKIATDHDGKVDNLKEFKMAKRLYPYVTKTYEVSENGTLLVAEYISPFSSYSEMAMYADQIRDILTKLSSTYLIGDVGITSKNYANWGLRAGSSQPVCLDFAYVYEVSSDLFVCRKCNSMLVPDRDFKRLNCVNNSCGQEYSFEDIRAKIGNDIHKHEIGDLTEEGYYMTSSNVETELNEQRSNYLVKAKEKNNKINSKQIKEDTDMNNNIENNIFIASQYAGEDNPFRLPISQPKPIVATARVANESVNKNSTLIKAEAVAVKNKVEQALEENVAFSGEMDFSEKSDDSITKENNVETKVLQIPDHSKTYTSKEVINTEKQNNDQTFASDEINDWFIKNINRAFSKISNRISNCMHIDGQFDEVRHFVKGNKLYPEDYYRNVQNAVFRSLVNFCNFEVTVESNEKGNGTHKVFNPPSEIVGTAYEPTMIFISRVWNNRNVNTVEDPDMMAVYKSIYNDYQGIQIEWIEVLRQRLQEKLQMPKAAIDKIVDYIANEWCDFDTAEDIDEDFDEDFDEEFDAEDFDDESDKADEYIAFTGNMNVDVVQSSNDEEESIEEDIDEEDSSEEEFLSVEIYHESKYDIVKVNTSDYTGTISIPFYTKLDEIDINDVTPSIVDDRNGSWDWLIHVVPDLMFTTKNPDKWLRINDIEPDINRPHVAIMDEEDGLYTMGVYFLKGIFVINDDGNMIATFDEILIKKINKLIKDDIGYNNISRLVYSLNNVDLIYEEKEMMKMMDVDDLNDEEDYSDEEEIIETNNHCNDDAKDAAIAAMMDDETESSDCPFHEEESQERKEKNGEGEKSTKKATTETKETTSKTGIEEQESQSQKVFKPIRRK